LKEKGLAEGFGGFVASTADSLAAGCGDPVPGRNLHSLLTAAFALRA